jgi:glycosyltransferase involved in cell wall biosynthesis
MSLVSVIIPAYNKSEYTCRAVDSVLNQTYSPVELIVVDDGSTDDTRERMAAYADRLVYIRKPNGGACSARNAGIRIAKGEFIGLLDCDDMYLPQKIELSVKHLQDHPELGFVHTKAFLIDREDKTVRVYERPENRTQGWIAPRLILGNFICNSTVVIRKSCLDAVGLYDESIFTPADWDMWLRLSERYQTDYIDVPLTKYRITDNYIFNKLELAEREEAVMIEKFFERNRSLDRLKGKVLSNWHLRYAQCYVVKEDGARVKNELKQALALNPYNAKAWAVRILNTLAHAPLKSVLEKKILRYNT